VAWEGGVGTAAGYKLQVAVPLAPRHDDRRGSRNFAPFAMIRVKKNRVRGYWVGAGGFWIFDTEKT